MWNADTAFLADMDHVGKMVAQEAGLSLVGGTMAAAHFSSRASVSSFHTSVQPVSSREVHHIDVFIIRRFTALSYASLHLHHHFAGGVYFILCLAEYYETSQNSIVNTGAVPH